MKLICNGREIPILSFNYQDCTEWKRDEYTNELVKPTKRRATISAKSEVPFSILEGEDLFSFDFFDYNILSLSVSFCNYRHSEEDTGEPIEVRALLEKDCEA